MKRYEELYVEFKRMMQLTEKKITNPEIIKEHLRLFIESEAESISIGD